MSVGFRRIASSITNKLGTTFTYQTITSTFDPVLSKTVETIDSIPRLKAGIASYDDRLIDGTTILATDLQMIIPAASIPSEPKPGSNRILLKAGLYTVIKTKTHYDGDEVAAYEVQIRTA